LEINKTVIVASRWFLYYLTYIDDARSNTNQVIGLVIQPSLLSHKHKTKVHTLPGNIY